MPLSNHRPDGYEFAYQAPQAEVPKRQGRASRPASRGMQQQPTSSRAEAMAPLSNAIEMSSRRRSHRASQAFGSELLGGVGVFVALSLAFWLFVQPML